MDQKSLLAGIIASAPVSAGWLFDMAEIGCTMHWLSSESLGDFTSLHRGPPLHEYNAAQIGRD